MTAKSPAQILPARAHTELTRRQLLAGTTAVVGGALLASALPASIAEASSLPPNASEYVALNPFRVLDTRLGVGRPSRRIGENRLRIAIGGYTDPVSRQRVDPAATAVVVAVAAVNGPFANHVQAFPSDVAQPPTVAVMNLRTPGQVTSNMATTRLSSRGEFDINTLKNAQIIVDVIGYYKPVTQATSGGRFETIAPARAYDSRTGAPKPGDRSSVLVDVTPWTAGNATAVVINLAAVLSKGPGHVAAVPAWQRSIPTTSTLNLKYAGDIVSASAIVPVRNHNGRRKIRIYAHTSCHVIVDVSGYYTGTGAPRSTEGLFVPLTPQRILDTRGMWPDQLGRRLGRLWHGWTVEAKLTNHAAISTLTANQIGAVAVNLTAFESRGFPSAAGHFTLSAAGLGTPGTASVNWSQPGSYAANHVISEVSTDGLQIHAVTGAAAIIDLNGYFVGTPKRRRLRAISPNSQTPPAIPPTWRLQLPDLWDASTGQYGRWHSVIAHQDGDAAVDSGNLWHWTNTGYMLDDRDVFIMGHRTSAGGPLRYLHRVPVGSLMYIDTTDGRRYTFRFAGMNLTTSAADSILGAARGFSGATVSLVACTAGPGAPGKAWYEPTSVDWRIVSTFELVGWRATSD